MTMTKVEMDYTSAKPASEFLLFLRFQYDLLYYPLIFETSSKFNGYHMHIDLIGLNFLNVIA